MTAPASVILIATPGNYKLYDARCPACRGTWIESPHTLYNVVALPCPWCGGLLAVREGDWHGDDHPGSATDGG